MMPTPEQLAAERDIARQAAERACCVEAAARLLPQFRFVHMACGHATNCPEHIKHVHVPPGAIPLEAILEERTRHVREEKTP